MAKSREILSQRQAIRNIRTATKAMETVATTRLKKSQRWAADAKPYTAGVAGLADDIIAPSDLSASRHPLLRAHGDLKRNVILVLTSNRGLCGEYNSNVLRVALRRLGQLLQAGYSVPLHVVGKRGVDHLRARGIEPDMQYTRFDDLADYHEVSRLAMDFSRAFIDGTISGLEVVYTEFISSSRGGATVATLLPLSPGRQAARKLPASMQPPDHAAAPADEPTAYEFMPSGEGLLALLLPKMVRLRLFQCFLDAAAAEQLARIVAMRAATDNADQMVHDLTLRYNRLRQRQITGQLAEILGGREGVR